MRIITVIIFLFVHQLSFPQTKNEIDSLLILIAKTPNSKDISKSSEAKMILNYGDKALPILLSFFTDTTLTEVRSDCQDTTLNKGEIAIILADTIERMPYALLTGIQNCLLTFCENNSNLIEYYLDAIRENGITTFENKYVNWLDSNDRKTWPDYKKNKTKSKKKKQVT